MSTIDSNKDIQKVRTEKEMRKALSNLIHHKHTMCVPPQIDDEDIIVMDVIEELLEARKKLAILEPLRDAMTSEHAWEEALRDQGGSEKVLEPVVMPFVSVKTPIRDAINASAIATREAAEKAANAELEPYINSEDMSYQRRGIPGYKALARIPVISTENLDLEAMNREIAKEDALYFIGLDDGYHGTKSLEVLREEQKG